MSHFKAPVKYKKGGTGSGASQFQGLPVGMELFSKYQIFDPFTVLSLDTLPGAAEEPGEGWTDTAVSVGTGTSAFSVTDDITPQRLRIVTAANENDGIQAQYTDPSGSGMFFDLVANKLRYFEVAFVLWDANDDLDTVQQCDFFFGFAATDTSVIGGAADYIGFSKVDGSGVINFVAGKNSTTIGDQISQTTGVTLVAADAGESASLVTTLGFVMDGTEKAYVFANGSHIATVDNTTQFPDDVNIGATIAFLSGEAVVKNCDILKFIAAVEI